jgi:hypothetical protein
VELSTGERIDAFYFSPDAFSKRTSANTIAEQVGEGLSGSGISFPAQADNDRIGGARPCYNAPKANLVTSPLKSAPCKSTCIIVRSAQTSMTVPFSPRIVPRRSCQNPEPEACILKRAPSCLQLLNSESALPPIELVSVGQKHLIVPHAFLAPLGLLLTCEMVRLSDRARELTGMDGAHVDGDNFGLLIACCTSLGVLAVTRLRSGRFQSTSAYLAS